MSTQNLTLAMKLLLDSQQFTQGLLKNSAAVKKFGQGLRDEAARIRNAFGSVQGKLAAVGASVGAVATVVKSAQLDKSLTQIGLTAGVGQTEVEKLRKKLFQLAKETGRPIGELQAGFNNLVQSGLSFNEALPVIEATNKAMAVSTASAESLTSAISVAGAQFNFDLAKPETAVELLDKMLVAGRLANAEIDKLSGIFSTVGTNAKDAGLSFDQTLAFIQGLSNVERQPEKLATLANSTLRLFTSGNYRKTAQAATGVRFFDENGGTRDPLKVIDDMRAKFKSLETAEQRASFIDRAFGSVDIDTQRGLRTLFGGKQLDDIGRFTKAISTASGAIARDLPDAINNSVDQVGRLKAALGESADTFSRKINAGVSVVIKKLMDPKEKGGFELSGNQMLGIGGAAVGAAYVGKRFGGAALKKLLGGATNLAEGVAVGQAMKASGAATPVYVVNMPNGGIGGGIGDAVSSIARGSLGRKALGLFGRARIGAGVLMGAESLGALGMAGSAGIAGASALVAGAGAVGYGAGKYIVNPLINAVGAEDLMGALVTHIAAFLGSSDAQESLALRKKNDALFKGSLEVTITNKSTKVTALNADPGFDIDVSSIGNMWAIP
jgi:TP901 family phage tail tape measure protein